MSATHKLQQNLAYSLKGDELNALRLNKTTGIEELSSWFERTGFATGLTYASTTQASAQYILKFRLSETYSSHFVKVRGFISLGGKSFRVSSDTLNQIFSIELAQNQEEAAREYFIKIFNWLHNEIQFREELKELIKLDQKYQKARLALLNKSGKKSIDLGSL